MSWKDIVKAPPFDLKERREKKIYSQFESLLPKGLEGELMIDDRLKDALSITPFAKKVTIATNNAFEDMVASLEKAGYTKTMLEKKLSELYNADRVYINLKNREMTFRF
tara:strand:- start:339 stop:665 length:327 start_codon:yes stop_codon:yes gene_type:complete